jgi:hypothetical protein
VVVVWAGGVGCLNPVDPVYTMAFMWRIFVLVLFSSLVLAADLDDAKDLYAKGEYLRASKLAASLETSEGYSFAARALAEYSNTRPKAERDEQYSQCEVYARKAVQLNPKNADGYFEIAVAVGQLAALRDVTYAISSGVPSQLKHRPRVQPAPLVCDGCLGTLARRNDFTRHWLVVRRKWWACARAFRIGNSHCA